MISKRFVFKMIDASTLYILYLCENVQRQDMYYVVFSVVCGEEVE